MDGRATEQQHGLRARAGDLVGTDVPRRAGALAGHGGLCLLAAFAAVVGLFGVAGAHPATSDAVLDVLRAIGASGLADSLAGPVGDLVRHKQLAVLVLVAGVGA